MTDKQDPIAHAARLLREAAEELRQAHAYNNSEGWENETDAKDAYDEHLAAAQALEDWEAAVGAGGVSGPLVGRAAPPTAQAEGWTRLPGALPEPGAKAWTAVDAQGLREGRWYMVTHDGVATLCEDRRDAEKEAKDADMAWPHSGPHRAVQLVEASDWNETSELKYLTHWMPLPSPPAEQQAAPKAAPGEPPGIRALMCVISSLRDTAHFSDEEGGELMSALCALRDWAHAQTVAAPQPSTAAQADSVQEDAARWHWMAGYIVGTRTDLDDELIACPTVDELRKLVDAYLAAARAAQNEGEKP